MDEGEIQVHVVNKHDKKMNIFLHQRRWCAFAKNIFFAAPFFLVCRFFPYRPVQAKKEERYIFFSFPPTTPPSSKEQRGYVV
jgi:hypothetical protein